MGAGCRFSAMDLSQVKNYTDVIDLGAAALGDRDMVVLGDDRVSWNDMQGRAGQVANALVADGVGSQDRVAFIDKNSIEFFELAFGAAYVNAVTVAVNWRLAPPEMAYIINDSQAKVLIVHEEFAGHLATFEADLVHTTRIVVIGSHDSHASYDAWRDAHDGAFQRVGPCPGQGFYSGVNVHDRLRSIPACRSFLRLPRPK